MLIRLTAALYALYIGVVVQLCHGHTHNSVHTITAGFGGLKYRKIVHLQSHAQADKQPRSVRRDVPPTVNMRPVIGVLAQETGSPATQKYGDTFFMASYVKFLQMGGAQVVPIRVGEDVQYYTSIFMKINGVLFPGGGVDLMNSNYAKAAKILFKLAMQANDAGDYFPILGICLGHELLSVLVSEKKWLHSCDAEKLMIPVDLQPDALNSYLLHGAPMATVKIMSSYNVTANMHKFCLTPQNFSKSGLDKFFKVVSTNQDRQGLEFISMMEGIIYPFYGLQWHPEKNVFIWDLSIPLNHTKGAVQVTQYFSDFFVEEARRSKHQFADLRSESSELIENYNPVYQGAPTFSLNYYFNFTKAAIRKSTKG